MILANAPEAINAETSTVHIKTPDADWIELPAARKHTTARRIIRLAEQL
jgi:hypothetical protein